MKETLNNEYYNIDNILHNINSGMLSPPIINTPNISYYGNSPSPYVEQGPGDQEMKNEEETPLLDIKFEQNSPGVEREENNEEKNEEKNGEIPGKTIETKNTTLGINSNGIEITPEIQNIVSTAELNCELNLKEIALQAKNVKYDPKKFSGLIMKLREPKTTALIFPNGKMVCLGAKNEEQSKHAIRKFAKIIKKLKYNVSLKNFKIQNIVGSCKLKFKLPLSALCHYITKKMNSRVAYEPELFPGLIYHYLSPRNNSDDINETNPNIVFLIFSSGNIIIAGAKTRNQIFESFSQVYPLLHMFKEPQK